MYSSVCPSALVRRCVWDDCLGNGRGIMRGAACCTAQLVVRSMREPWAFTAMATREHCVGRASRAPPRVELSEYAARVSVCAEIRSGRARRRGLVACVYWKPQRSGSRGRGGT
eukprot:1287624-Prymnesium_polylepis.1